MLSEIEAAFWKHIGNCRELFCRQILKNHPVVPIFMFTSTAREFWTIRSISTGEWGGWFFCGKVILLHGLAVQFIDVVRIAFSSKSAGGSSHLPGFASQSQPISINLRFSYRDTLKRKDRSILEPKYNNGKSTKKRVLYTLFSFALIWAIALFISNVFHMGNKSISADYKNDNDDKEENRISEKSVPAFKVVIDAGHGGKDKGASGASGRFEKDFTLSVAKKVQKLLEQEPQIKVFMTRTDDTFISQESGYRPDFANELNANLFVSIHGNTFEDPAVSGTEVFYYHEYSRDFAEVMQKHVAAATGFPDRGVKKESLFVVRDTVMPAVLIEVGYLTNPADEAKMWTDGFQEDVAAAIVEAIKEYLHLNLAYSG